MHKPRTLVTGGAGYIGSHAVVALLEDGHDVVVVDNLGNSSERPLQRIRDARGRAVEFVQADVRDATALERVFASGPIGTVLHFAGLKSVAESTRAPLEYYLNNVAGTATLCSAMARHGVFRLVFSSSATVYGDPDEVPVREDFPLREPTNPYGRTKLVAERMLAELAQADPRWRIALLRYFNPVGAHPDGLVGEDPSGVPNNLMPYVCQVAAGKLSELQVYGDDYPTPDGTGVRDYIHVVDLVAGHLRAMDALERAPGAHVWNLGCGRGFSVLEIIAAFERVNGVKVPFRIVGRRAGDVAASWADVSKAKRELGWEARLSLDDMLRTAWRWQQSGAA